MSTFYRLIKSIPIQMLFVIVIVLFFGELIPKDIKSFFYTLSLLFKDILIFTLPFIVFSCLLNSMSSFRGQAFKFVIILFLCICFSNFLGNLLAYFSCQPVLAYLHLETMQRVLNVPELKVLLTLNLKPLFSNDQALILGACLGICISTFKIDSLERFSSKLLKLSLFLLKKLFIPVLPVFAFGFLLKIQNDKLFENIFSFYGPVLLFIVILYLVYLNALYLIGANFNVKLWGSYLKNVFPSGFMGLTTMSSMAALPLTLEGAELNTKNAKLSRAVIPATVNVHLIGDSFAVPILAISLLYAFGYGVPDFTQYLIFSFYFVLAKFAVAAVPAGGIIVVLPILEKHLHMKPELAAIMTTSYIIFDAIITTANIYGNGAFAILFSKFFHKKL